MGPCLAFLQAISDPHRLLFPATIDSDRPGDLGMTPARWETFLAGVMRNGDLHAAMLVQGVDLTGYRRGLDLAGLSPAFAIRAMQASPEADHAPRSGARRPARDPPGAGGRRAFRMRELRRGGDGPGAVQMQALDPGQHAGAAQADHLPVRPADSRRAKSRCRSTTPRPRPMRRPAPSVMRWSNPSTRPSPSSPHAAGCPRSISSRGIRCCPGCAGPRPPIGGRRRSAKPMIPSGPSPTGWAWRPAMPGCSWSLTAGSG